MKRLHLFIVVHLASHQSGKFLEHKKKCVLAVNLADKLLQNLPFLPKLSLITVVLSPN